MGMSWGPFNCQGINNLLIPSQRPCMAGHAVDRVPGGAGLHNLVSTLQERVWTTNPDNAVPFTWLQRIVSAGQFCHSRGSRLSNRCTNLST